MTIALSHAQSDFKLAGAGQRRHQDLREIGDVSEQDAAALYAAIWKNSRRAAPGARVAARRVAQ